MINPTTHRMINKKQIALYLAGLVSGIAITAISAVTLLDGFDIQSSITHPGIASKLVAQLEQIEAQVESQSTYRVIFLGDSMAMTYPERSKIPSRLEQVLRKTDAASTEYEFSIARFGVNGAGMFDYYCFADSIAKTEPDLVIIGFNLASLSNYWRESFSRPEFSGWVGAYRYANAARLPLQWSRLTFDRLLFFGLIVRAHGVESWVRLTSEQTRVNAVPDLLAESLATKDAAGRSPAKRLRQKHDVKRVQRAKLPGEKRLSASGMHRYFGPVLDGLSVDHPILQFLGATIAVFRSHEIDVLIYITPFNIEHARRVGVIDDALFSSSLAAIETVALGSRAQFTDLHDLLPDAFSRDLIGHYKIKGETNGTLKIAEAIAPAVREIARGSR